MSLNNIRVSQLSLIDPVEFSKSSPYIQNGLTYISNNNAIHPRDDAGNIILSENSDTNPLLIIEPTVKQISTRSVIKVVDTAFKYFKFPVSVRSTETLPDLDLDFNIDIDIADPVYARYKPSENRRIPASGIYSGILMDEIEDGGLQKNSNNYYITKEIKNSGKDLRFRIKIQHRFDNTRNLPGTAFFSLMKSGPNYDLVRAWDELGGGEIGQYEVKNTFFERIIRNSEFEIGDNFSIGALAGQNNDNEFHTINSDQSYWVITDADKNVDEWNQEI
jgi:hypothetical protein